MRLLFISNVFPNPLQPTRGAFNRELAGALARRHAVHVIAPVAWADEWRARVRMNPQRRTTLGDVSADHPRYYYTPKILRGQYGRFLWLSTRDVVRRRLESHRPDVVLAYWAHPDGEVAVRAARLAGVPAVVMVGGSDVLLLARSSDRRRRIVNVLRSADAVVAVSGHLRDRLVNFGIEPNKVHVVYRGVDSNRFTAGDRSAARRRLGIPPDERVAVWVGRMVPVKAVDVLLEAVGVLRQRGVSLWLYLIGDGPLRHALEARVRARGLTDRCAFAGAVRHERLADWYRAADVAVLPSLSEGVPNVLREAQACGTPFVASHVGGIPEIADPATDLLVPPGDVAALALALEKITARPRPALPSRPPPAGWDVSAHELTRILEEVLRGAGRPENREPALHSGPPWWAPRQLARRVLAAALPRRRFLVSGPAGCRSVCLTFDDGPHPEHTPRLLDALKERGVRATFFLIGRQAEQYPDVVRRIADEGHAIGHHSYTHSAPPQTPARELVDEIHRTQDLFVRLVGRPSELFRPPLGKVSAIKLWRLWQAGMQVVLWNADPKDYARSSPEQVRAWFAVRGLRGGDVVLMHDTRPFAAEIVADLTAAAAERGLTFATVDQWV
jgi:glycosyltransferase involved in cell wall biosynthesis/peptidoglycan/xylan/chitin deacetylase (PgdA/CDA1 family)